MNNNDMYSFYFQDTFVRVEWWDHPENHAGPWRSAYDALNAFYRTGMGSEPADACYVLLTES